MIESGCLNCKERNLRCHADCEKYNKYKNELDKIKENKKKERDLQVTAKRKRK